MNNPRPRQFRSRLTVIGVFLLFFGPIFIALWLNIARPPWFAFGSVNHGVLIDPVRRADPDGLRWVDGDQPSRGDPFVDNWTLVILGTGPCAIGCREVLEETRTVRRALGREMDRLQRLLVIDETHRAGWLKVTPSHRHDLVVTTATTRWLERFAGTGHEDRLFVVDPQGYVIVRYPIGTAAKALTRDLERLLKISKIG